MCIIDYKNKFIYIAIPKTGSQSTETYLKKLHEKKCTCIGCTHKYDGTPEPDLLHDLNLCPHIGGCRKISIRNKEGIPKQKLCKHSTALEIKNAIPEYDEFTKITTIRNPFDWYVSWWSYSKGKPNGWSSTRKTLYNFEEWLELATKNKQSRYNNFWLQDMINWLVDENKNLIVDKIFYYENLEKEYVSFFNKFNFCNYFPKINTSEKRKDLKYNKFHNKKTKKIVEKKQKETLKYFKYNFCSFA